MKTFFLYLLLFSFQGISISKAQTTYEKNEKQMKKIDELIEKKLPESALKEIDLVLQEAAKENDFQKSIKAYLYKMRVKLEKDPDESEAIIRDFEVFALNFKDETEKALLHSMTAELYLMYYEENEYKISERKSIQNFVPKELNEWSGNLFFEKIAQELEISLRNTATLQKTDVLQFRQLIEMGKTSRDVQSTLFDFLSERAINILEELSSLALIKNPLLENAYFSPIESFVAFQQDSLYTESIENKIIKLYQEWLSFLQTKNNKLALINIDLQRLDFVHQHSDNVEAAELYLQSLLDLQNKYKKEEVVVEIMNAIVEYYEEKLYLTKTSSEERKKLKTRAYEICLEGIENFPNYKRINLLINKRNEFEQKKLEVKHAKIAKPESTLIFNTKSRNINSLELKLYRVDADREEYYNFQKNHSYRQNTPFPKRHLVDKKIFSLHSKDKIHSTENKLELKTREYGIYEFSLSEKESTNKDEEIYGSFTVSDFMFLERMSNRNKSRLYVLDRESGKPLKDVDVTIFSSIRKKREITLQKLSTARTDKDGFSEIDREENSTSFFFQKDKDAFFTAESYDYYSEAQKAKDKRLSLFTDRAIYRPGQTVYFKGILYSYAEQKVVQDSICEIELVDVNWRAISKLSLKSNEFGSFTGEFKLPKEGLNGTYQLKSKLSGNVSFLVEEYKRPSFEIELDKIADELHFDKEIQLSGTSKSYAGFPTAHAKIKYSIQRHPHLYCWWMPNTVELVANGQTTSDSEGIFSISFVPKRIKQEYSKDQLFRYRLLVEVTDTKGETQTASKSFSVGDKSLFIVASAPETHERNRALKIPTKTQNLNDETIPSIVNYELFSLKENTIYREEMKNMDVLSKKEKKASGTFQTKDKEIEIDTKRFSPGYYRLVLTTKDTQNREIKTVSTFVLYDSKKKTPPIKAYRWLETIKTECEVGEIAKIRFGTSAKNSYVLYEIMDDKKLLQSSWVKLNNETKEFEIPYSASYKEGVSILFTLVKDEKVFITRTEIKLKKEDKNIKPFLSSFRNKLKPGENVEWSVTIPEMAAKNKIAELLISMYDASLDAISPHSWYFNPSYHHISKATAYRASGLSVNYETGNFPVDLKKVKPFQFDRLNWQGLQIDSYGMYFDGGMLLMKESIQGTQLRSENMKSKEFVAASETQEVEEDVDSPLFRKVEQKKEAPKTVRSNFNETAFFYPQLQTDKEGQLSFKFTVPESLTRWKIQMLAHSPDLFFGEATETAITQKELMVQLNMPRFVRRSDKLKLVANVTNLSEKELETKLSLQLIDPETEKSIKFKNNKPKTVLLKSKESKTVEWELSEFSNYELLKVKVNAQSETFDDGEQHYLPILPDKVLITESMPLTVRANETRKFYFKNLQKKSKDVDSKSLTFEFSGNPSWYAVQALPTLATPLSENTIDLFAAFYANSLASHIANATPRIKEIYTRWEKEAGSSDALLSNLEKNAELKNILLEETPWIIAAKNESEQKKKIAQLFFLNQRENQTEQILKKLLKLQTANGGFPWFKGMPDNRDITQYILLGMAQHKKITASKSPSYPWMIKAIDYLDSEIERDYKKAKANKKKNRILINDTQWLYLYIRSEYRDIPQSNETKKAIEHYSSLAEKYWNKTTLYGQAVTALIANRNGNSKLAKQIIKSLKENAKQSDEFGMYWAKNKFYVLGYKSPILTQTSIMEAFAEIDKNDSYLEEMKIWLLKEKQTEVWDSPITSINAIYALLHYGSDWLTSETDVEIKTGDIKLQTDNKEAGTGYLKKSFTPTEIEPKMANVSVEKKGKGIGWGAVYWQFYQDLEEVTQTNGALSINKKLFVEKTENGKTTMLPLEKVKAKKGDKIIVRLYIKNDRNLEFVALKDLRAACFESVEQTSTIEWDEGVLYYKTSKDSSTQFFFPYLPKGSYVFEYELWANNAGDFVSGVASIQCQYAPEFVGQSSGERIVIY